MFLIKKMIFAKKKLAIFEDKFYFQETNHLFISIVLVQALHYYNKHLPFPG